MRTNFARGWTMLTAHQAIDHARPLAEKLVEFARRATGSRMAAYESVARKIGASPSWLRKFIGRQPNVDLGAHQYLNVISLYRRLCERVEAEAENERRKLELILEQHDADCPSFIPMVPASSSDDYGEGIG